MKQPIQVVIHMGKFPSTNPERIPVDEHDLEAGWQSSMNHSDIV